MLRPVAAPDRQLLGLDVDIAAVFIEDGTVSIHLGRVLKMLVPSTGNRRSLKAIVHAVDPYDMPAGLRLSCRWYEPVENSTLEYEYTLDDSARYEGTCFLSFVNLAYDQQQGVYRLSPEDAATLEELRAAHQQKENDENDDDDGD